MIAATILSAIVTAGLGFYTYVDSQRTSDAALAIVPFFGMIVLTAISLAVFVINLIHVVR